MQVRSFEADFPPVVEDISKQIITYLLSLSKRAARRGMPDGSSLGPCPTEAQKTYTDQQTLFHLGEDGEERRRTTFNSS